MSTTYVKVIWTDATSNSHTCDADDVEFSTCLMETVGILAADKKEGLVICTDYCPSLNEYRCLHTIPRGMVVNVILLLAHGPYKPPE